MRVAIHRVEDNGKIVLLEGAGLAIVTLNRPTHKNAMTMNMWQELKAITQSIQKNSRNQCVIFRGAGPQFTAGSDIKEFHCLGVEEAERAFMLMEEAISAVERLSIPTIASIDGPAIGAGMVLAAACDIRIGSPRARLGIPIGRLGITLNQNFVHRLVRLIGPSLTKDLVYTGRMLYADEALRWGLINYVNDEEKLEQATLRLAHRIISQSTASLKGVKEAVSLCTPIIQPAPGTRPYPEFVDPQDFPEGVAAFVEKRPPRFTDKKKKA
ncbi:enoyl-CoA hydratase/isomerase family protein [Salinithrix halophila]|uniref:Enoyl-CoA hydratase/isomerase family protein n=1 Tax=Salinithrix halophila TaxID=1485204 RepID=A0ABV8JCN2_9BACL